VAASFLVLDIETILDPELPIASGDPERLPSPPHHKVVVIGGLLFDAAHEVRRINVFGELEDEAGILEDFARTMEERQPTLVTFNGRGFDMPVIATRCFRHGIPFRHYYRSREVRYRFSSEGHLDLMDYVADFGASKPSKLDILAKLCGMPGKVGIDGKDVGPMVHAGRIQEVRNYCLCDVVQTAGVFLRLQLVRGEIERERYLQSMRGLIALIKTDARLQLVAEALDARRLLLDNTEGSTPLASPVELTSANTTPVEPS